MKKDILQKVALRALTPKNLAGSLKKRLKSISNSPTREVWNSGVDKTYNQMKNIGSVVNNRQMPFSEANQYRKRLSKPIEQLKGLKDFKENYVSVSDILSGLSTRRNKFQKMAALNINALRNILKSNPKPFMPGKGGSLVLPKRPTMKDGIKSIPNPQAPIPGKPIKGLVPPVYKAQGPKILPFQPGPPMRLLPKPKLTPLSN